MTGKAHGDTEPFSGMGVLQQPIALGGPSLAPAPAPIVPPLIDMDKINPPAVRSVHEVGANVACLAKFSGVYRECSTSPPDALKDGANLTAAVPGRCRSRGGD